MAATVADSLPPGSQFPRLDAPLLAELTGLTSLKRSLGQRMGQSSCDLLSLAGGIWNSSFQKLHKNLDLGVLCDFPWVSFCRARFSACQ